MICKKCESVVHDNEQICPVCGYPLIRLKLRKAKRLRFCLLLSPILNFILAAINIFVIMVAGHLPIHIGGDIFYNFSNAYILYPGLKAVNLTFSALHISFFLLAIYSLFHLQKSRQSGPILLAISHVLQLVSTLLYPVMLYAVDGISSPIWIFTASISIIYAVTATATTLYLFRSGKFIL